MNNNHISNMNNMLGNSSLKNIHYFHFVDEKKVSFGGKFWKCFMIVLIELIVKIENIYFNILIFIRYK